MHTPTPIASAYGLCCNRQQQHLLAAVKRRTTFACQPHCTHTQRVRGSGAGGLLSLGHRVYSQLDADDEMLISRVHALSVCLAHKFPDSRAQMKKMPPPQLHTQPRPDVVCLDQPRVKSFLVVTAETQPQTSRTRNLSHYA